MIIAAQRFQKVVQVSSIQSVFKSLGSIQPLELNKHNLISFANLFMFAVDCWKEKSCIGYKNPKQSLL